MNRFQQNSLPLSAPPTGIVPETEAPATNNKWVTYRDPRYGVGLAPDKVLFVSPLFQDRLGTNDIQGILNSLSLNPDQSIVVPAFAPHEPLIAATCAGE